MGRPRAPEKIVNEEKYQRCSKCFKYKTYNEFSKSSARHNGIESICRCCKRKKNPKSPGRKPNPIRTNALGQQEKLCTGCNDFKTFDSFNKHTGRLHNLSNNCKDCEKSKSSYTQSLKRQKKDAKMNREKLHNQAIQNGKECNCCHQHLDSSAFDSSVKFKDGFQKTCRECRRVKANKSTAKSAAIRIKKDPIQRLKANARRAVLSAFRYVGTKKNSRTYKIIGLQPEEFWNYLKEVSKTNPDIEECHMDHIIPISLAQSEAEVRALSHYSNFQWLGYDENIRKRHIYIKDDELTRVISLNPYPNVISDILTRSGLKIVSKNYEY